MANDFVQTMIDARVDARSLSDFMFYPASEMVARRLAPSIHTLNYYLDYFNGLESLYSQESGTVTVNGVEIKTVRQAMNDAIDDVLLGEYQEGMRADLNAQKLDTGITATAKFGGVERTQAEKNSDTVSVKDFGAKGDGIANDSPAFQAALGTRTSNGWTFLRVPMGTYLLNESIELPSNLYLKLDAGVKILHNSSNESLFLNGVRGDDTYAYGYSGNGNIIISGFGAEVDLGYNPARTYSCCFAIGHALNVLIEGITIRNGYHSHNIEINSSKNVTLSYMQFYNHRSNSVGLYETVQIDYASSGGFPSMGAADGTHCEDIYIDHCTFRDTDCAIGSHAVPLSGLRHKNIHITNCNISNVRGKGIRAEAWDGVHINYNTLYNFSISAEYFDIWGSKDVYVRHNEVTPLANQTGFIFYIGADRYNPPDTPIGRHLSDNVYIEYNTIGGSATGFYIYRCSNVFINKNRLTDMTTIVNSDDCTTLTFNDNRVYSSGRLWLKGTINPQINNNTVTGLIGSHFVDASSTSTNLSANNNTVDGLIPADTAFLKGTIPYFEYNGSTKLFSGSGVTSGDISLVDDISKYSSVIVLSGSVGGGTYTTFEERPWFLGSFSTSGSRVLQGVSATGRVKLKIKSTNTLEVVQADDSVRAVFGTSRKS